MITKREVVKVTGDDDNDELLKCVILVIFMFFLIHSSTVFIFDFLIYFNFNVYLRKGLVKDFIGWYCASCLACFVRGRTEREAEAAAVF